MRSRSAHCSPFVYSPNDLPTARLQYLFNERLLQNAAGILHDKVRLYAGMRNFLAAMKISDGNLD